MPFPCHAVPLRVYNVPLPFDLHSAAVSDSHLPWHVLTMPFFSRPWHSTVVKRRPMGYLPTFGFFRLPRGVPWRLLSEAYQSSSQRSIPTTVKSGSTVAAHDEKDNLLNCWTSSLDISSYHADFNKGHGTVKSMAGAWHGMCELRTWHDRGTAWAQHAMCESALSWPEQMG
jgi:hypothetical protein